MSVYRSERAIVISEKDKVFNFCSEVDASAEMVTSSHQSVLLFGFWFTSCLLRCLPTS